MLNQLRDAAIAQRVFSSNRFKIRFMFFIFLVIASAYNLTFRLNNMWQLDCVFCHSVRHFFAFIVKKTKKYWFSQKVSCSQNSISPVTAYSTPLTTMDKTRARRDMLCPYLKIKLTELMLNNSLDKYFPHFEVIYLYIYILIYTLT